MTAAHYDTVIIELAYPASGRPVTSPPSSRTGPWRSWSAGKRWAAPGIFSVTRGFARIRHGELRVQLQTLVLGSGAGEGQRHPRLRRRNRAGVPPGRQGAVRPEPRPCGLVQPRSSSGPSRRGMKPPGKRGPSPVIFLVNCAGYYNYDHGYRPHFEGEESFEGEIIHPQQWPENFDYTDRKVVVIGSGATAITVVPAMADKAAKVTMLQRSPSYILSVPDTDRISMLLSTFLPKRWCSRWRGGATFCSSGVVPCVHALAPDDAQGSTVPHAQESRTRRRHASLHAGLQSLGAASVRGAGRRFLQQPALRKGRHCDRPY